MRVEGEVEALYETGTDSTQSQRHAVRLSFAQVKVDRLKIMLWAGALQAHLERTI